MPINNQALVDVLKKLGFTHLYHANSVSTWVTFIEQGALLSRKYVKEAALWQTYQKSDKTDIEKGVDDDVFLDVMDLHSVFHRNNEYGPVLGVFPVETLCSADFIIEITQNNPIYWDKSPQYFDNLSEYENQLKDCWEKNDKVKIAQMMITLRSPATGFSLVNLESLILDQPYISLSSYGNRYDLYDMAYTTLNDAANNEIAIQQRNCRAYCKCNDKYTSNCERTAFLFLDKCDIKHSLHREFHN